VTAGEYGSESVGVTLHGINVACGREVFAVSARLPRALDPRKLGETHQVEIVEDPEADAALVGVPRESRPGDTAACDWYLVPLPRPDAGPVPILVKTPPKPALEAGVAFEWRPELEGVPAGATFRLETAPEGMTIDAKTGALSWKPEASAAGKHDVAVVAKAGDDEIPVFGFTILVKGAR